MAGRLNPDWPIAAHLGIAHPDAPMLAASAGSVDPVAQIACAARLGFAGITDNGLKLRSAQTRRRMGDALRDHGMTMGSFTHNVLGFEAPFFWGGRIGDMEGAMAPTLEAAKQVGGGIVNTILIDSGGRRSDQRARAADNLAAAAEMAAAHGVAIAVEAISRARVPLALVEGAVATAAIVRGTGAAGLGLIFDSCHCRSAGDDMAAALVAHADIVAGVQIADMPGRVEPGAGRIAFAPIMAALRTIGWRGVIEAELMPSRTGMAGEAAMVAALAGLGV